VGEKEIEARFQARGEDNIFHNYVNCVIFPKKGEIPVTSQISGSDLDGDNFFICWDQELVPENDEPIYVIDAPVKATDGGNKAVNKKEVEVVYQEMLNFFVEYLNYEKLGQIDNSHLVHADRSPFYAKSKECVELAIAHGKAVDFPKSGFCPEVDPKLLVSTYPDFMEKEESVIIAIFSPSTSASPSWGASTATSKSA
jgi:RNA-dependent RNA polymerase